MRQFRLPDLGEGLEEAEIVTWHVNEGDRVVIDQPLVSVETDKAVVEVPSPWSGQIARLFGGKGDLIKVGAPLVEFAEGERGDTGTVVGELGQEEKAPRAAEPPLNAWYNAQAGERRLIKRIDIGIAVDTEGGLIVPVLRNVGERDARDLRAGIDRLRADAAARSIPPEELRGATITLSNFGMIGGRFANLIVVPPQVAIIGAGRIDQRVLVHNGAPAARRVLPLSLTVDHRVVTGGEAARFLVALKADLEQTS